MCLRDGHSWRVGTQLDVGWTVDATVTGLAITSAIPPVYDAYATIVVPTLDAEPATPRRRPTRGAVWAVPGPMMVARLPRHRLR